MFVYSEYSYRNFAQTTRPGALYNIPPPQLEKRNSLFALELELLVCVHSRNDHKTGVRLKIAVCLVYFIFLVISRFLYAEKYGI